MAMPNPPSRIANLRRIISWLGTMELLQGKAVETDDANKSEASPR